MWGRPRQLLWKQTTQVLARERLEGSPGACAQRESERVAFTQVDRQLLRSLRPPQSPLGACSFSAPSLNGKKKKEGWPPPRPKPAGGLLHYRAF